LLSTAKVDAGRQPQHLLPKRNDVFTSLVLGNRFDHLHPIAGRRQLTQLQAATYTCVEKDVDSSNAGGHSYIAGARGTLLHRWRSKMSLRKRGTGLVVLAASLMLGSGGCSDDTMKVDTGSPDGSPDAALDGPAVTDNGLPDKGRCEMGPTDMGPTPDMSLTSLKVAAIQYDREDYKQICGCQNALCGIQKYIKDAAKQGAKLVLVPDYSAGQVYLEMSPNVGATTVHDTPDYSRKPSCQRQEVPHFTCS
jgi:hypothetical protein